MAILMTVRPMPSKRFIVFAEALFANLAVANAPTRVKEIHVRSIHISVIPPPMTKWDTAPVRAVNDMMNTLVPTAVFSS